MEIGLLLVKEGEEESMTIERERKEEKKETRAERRDVECWAYDKKR